MIRIGGAVVLAVAALRLLRSPLRERLLATLGQALDWSIGWQNLPLPLGIATLIAARNRLRQDNLYDTNTAPVVNPPALQGSSPRYLTARTYHRLTGRDRLQT